MISYIIISLRKSTRRNIIGSQINLEGSFELMKQDALFLNIHQYCLKYKNSKYELLIIFRNLNLIVDFCWDAVLFVLTLATNVIATTFMRSKSDFLSEWNLQPGSVWGVPDLRNSADQYNRLFATKLFHDIQSFCLESE